MSNMNQIEERILFYEPEEEFLDIEELYKYCHCCMKQKDDLKDMFSESFDNGEYEKYSDMLRACFSIHVETWTESEDDSKVMICDECIVKLRKCLLFRQLVEHTQWKIRRISGAVRNQANKRVEDMKHSGKKEQSENDAGTDNGKTILKKETKESNDILIKAISRTRKNLKLLKETNPNSKNNIAILLDKGLKGSIERRKYLSNYYYSKNIPYKLIKTGVVCEICNESFPTPIRLTRHMTMHYPSHKCRQCGKKFITSVLLKTHIQKVHDMEKLKCGICDQMFKKASLKRHISTHTGNTYRHHCKFCEESFNAYGACIKHMIQLHQYEGNRYKCKECPKVFILSGDLNKHVRKSHLGEKNYHCTQCDMSFFSSYLLKSHLIKHTRERRFQCDYCNKLYSRKQVLVEHMRIHINIRNHPCTVCDKSFTQKCSLVYHYKTHEVDQNVKDLETKHNISDTA